jgi:hypothetical protein
VRSAARRSAHHQKLEAAPDRKVPLIEPAQRARCEWATTHEPTLPLLLSICFKDLLKGFVFVLYSIEPILGSIDRALDCVPHFLKIEDLLLEILHVDRHFIPSIYASLDSY